MFASDGALAIVHSIGGEPTTAPAATGQADFIRYRTNNIAETTASAAAVTSMTATRPSCRVTPAINASHATLIPSSRAPAHGDRRRRRMNGWLAATKTNAGKKM